MREHHADRHDKVALGGMSMNRRIMRSEAGFTMIEILVSILVTVFGLLTLAGFVVNASRMTSDSVQRARAGILLDDMASRMTSNRAVLATYSGVQDAGAAVQNCGGLSGRNLDVCEWNNLLFGANDGGSSASLGYRGCIVRDGVDPNLYIVSVAWGSITRGVPPVDPCGAAAFAAENRRVVRTQVRFATLSG